MPRPCKVLLVDDDEELRDALGAALQAHGYQVRCMANGSEALAFLRSYPRPDAIVLDLMMPDMDGWEFRNRLREQPELGIIPVIYISAASWEAERLRFEDNAPFLVKPFDVSLLISTVRGSVGVANDDEVSTPRYPWRY
jgi:CheY-like chemotaxis protein